MKITLYLGSRGSAYGGAENTSAVLAAALHQHHPVEIVSSLEGFSIDRLASYSGVDLRGITARFVPFDRQPPVRTANPLANLRRQREWNARVSRGCDLFLNIGNVFPPFSQAPHAAIRIFFPWAESPYSKRHRGLGPARWRAEVRRAFHLREWKQRMQTYDFKVANSRFTQKWTKRFWGVDCEVIHPPVDLDFSPAEKASLIVSVGRFAVAGNLKKQLEMMQTFRRMTAAQRAGWEYATLGGVLDSPADQAYFDSVVREGEGVGGRALANLPRAGLKQLMERAKIFWHAAGYGEDEEKNPGSAEHFGQSTVEAMAAGCVPVVINRGGQPEIVEHGVSGFIWDTLGELEDYTRRLVDDDALRQKMAAAARARSAIFSRAAFAERFLQLLGPVLH